MIKYVDTNFVIILIRQIDAIRDYSFSTPPSPDLNSLVMFDVNGLYSLRRSANVVTAMDSLLF